MPQNQPISITDDRARLSIATQGGVVTEFSWDMGAGERRHWLRPGAGDPLAVASFPLVPFNNRIRDGRFSFGGKDVALPLNFRPQNHAIHGFGWQAAWQVTDKTDNAVTIGYRHAADAWPWPWRARQTFSLHDNTLTMEMEVTNEADGDMPVGLGFHPYHIRTPQASVTAQAKRVWLTDAEVMPADLVDPPAQMQIADGIVADQVPLDCTYTGWSGAATVRWPEWRAALTLEAAAPLTYLTVFTPPGEDFFCVEPVSTCTDAFNLRHTRDDTGTIVLAPGASQRVAARYTPSLEP